MGNGTLILAIVTVSVIAMAIIIFVIFMMRKKRKENLEHEIEAIETNKNLIISPSILTEFNKVESLVNNKNLEKKYENWKKKFDEIKNKDIPKVTDMLLNIENIIDSNDVRKIASELGKAELEVFYVKAKADVLLDEVRDITMSEERNRNAITKLKTIYRETASVFNKNKLEYKDVIKPIELGFENIDKLFSAFELAMDNKEFDEVSKIVKALDDLVNNMAIVIEEAPSIILLGKSIIPKKITDIKSISKRMVKNGYNIDYLNIDYNIDEAEKKLNDIFDRLNVLNLEDSIFELKTMLDYFESLYSDFDKEKISKKEYEEALEVISDKTSRLTKIVKNIYAELADLKISYDLTDEELEVIDNINVELKSIKNDFKNVNDRTKAKILPYSKLAKECELISVRLFNTEDKLENTLRTLGSLKEDEARAREQLEEIRVILRDAKYKIKEYKLTVVPKKYFVELKEAHEAINEIIKELEKKPISIKTLNTRVDTARDLVLKLFNTSKELTKTAAMAEMAIVYGNRYRSSIKEVEVGLKNAEKEFYKGEYRVSLELVLNAINIVEPGIHKKLLSAYEE